MPDPLLIGIGVVVLVVLVALLVRARGSREVEIEGFERALQALRPDTPSGGADDGDEQ